MSSKKIHFHTLDALRFFAFFKVFILHVPLEGDFPLLKQIKSGGGVGVLFFFVLSGFLITYILVQEKIQTGRLDVKKFFVRRALRIWPLYLFVVIVIFLLPLSFEEKAGIYFPSIGYLPDWRFSFTFLENYKMLLQDGFPNISPLSVFWSLCIEEHFYLIWMVAIWLIPVRYILVFLLASFPVGMVARIMEPGIWHNTNIMQNDIFTNLDYFAAGGVVGFAVATGYEKISAIVMRIPYTIKGGVLLVIVAYILSPEKVLNRLNLVANATFQPFIVAILFAILILIFIPAESKLRISENGILSYLGRISYGLYVYHLLIIHLLMKVFGLLHVGINSIPLFILFFVLAFLISVMVSGISYNYLEKPILSLRERIFSKRERV